MLKSQRDKFDLPDNVAYMNCSSMAPLMKDLAELGRESFSKRLRPYTITQDDWFEPANRLRRSFAKLINASDYRRIALVSSVSYGIASVTKNLKLAKDDEIVILADQFPSNYYSWLNLAKKYEARLKIVDVPDSFESKGQLWDENILKAINDKTKVVALGNIHWTDGTVFNLEAISVKAKEHDALLIIDGSQSIGAIPFDIEKIKPDAVFCVGYKWLLGAYGLGLAYYGEYFDDGEPLEENWINRLHSEDFQKLVDYIPDYKPAAARYNVGQHSNFHLLPLLNGSVKQILDWGVSNIQTYAESITQDSIAELKDLGCIIEADDFRSRHLFGIRFRKPVDLTKLHSRLMENNVFVSLRGSAVRVAVNVYNEQRDLEKLVECLKAAL